MFRRVIQPLSVRCALLCLLLASTHAYPAFHLVHINEVYSNADRSVQFIELEAFAGGQIFFSGQTITASGSVTNSFTFDHNLANGAAGAKILIATAGYAALSGVPVADFIVPNGFISAGNVTINFVGVDTLTIPMLPTDGTLSVDRNLATAVNSPTNNTGVTGRVMLPPPAPTLSAVFTRKIHGAQGAFDLAVNTAAGNVTVEPRMIGNGHTMVFKFSAAITSIGTATVTPTGVARAVLSGSEVIVTLQNVPDNQRATVSLAGVNGAVNVSATVGFLVGDVNSSRAVNASDIVSARARVGQTTNAQNFLFDINVSGSIDASDVSATKARAGVLLPL